MKPGVVVAPQIRSANSSVKMRQAREVQETQADSAKSETFVYVWQQKCATERKPPLRLHGPRWNKPAEVSQASGPRPSLLPELIDNSSTANGIVAPITLTGPTGGTGVTEHSSAKKETSVIARRCSGQPVVAEFQWPLGSSNYAEHSWSDPGVTLRDRLTGSARQPNDEKGLGESKKLPVPFDTNPRSNSTNLDSIAVRLEGSGTEQQTIALDATLMAQTSPTSTNQQLEPVSLAPAQVVASDVLAKTYTATSNTFGRTPRTSSNPPLIGIPALLSAAKFSDSGGTPGFAEAMVIRKVTGRTSGHAQPSIQPYVPTITPQDTLLTPIDAMQIRSVRDSLPNGKECIAQTVASSYTDSYPEGHPELTAGASSLDVTIFDRMHGWVHVSAALDGSGRVSASLNTTTSAAHDSLRAVVPEMINYLSAEDIRVSRVAVHRVPSELNTSSLINDSGAHQSSNSPKHHQQRQGSSSSDKADPRNFTRVNQTVGLEPNGRGSGPLRSWFNGLSRVSAGLALPFGIAPRCLGKWVNVCA
jgi:hypothetical protein